MTTRWPTLLLVILALTALALRAPAQDRRMSSTDPNRPSHRPINNGLENDASPEKRLANRLNRLKKEKNLDDELRNLAKNLLKDKKFVDSLRNLKPDDVKRLRQAIEANHPNVANDPDLKKLVDESLAAEKLTEDDKKLVQQWQDALRKGDGNITPPSQPNHQGNPNQHQPPKTPATQPGANAPNPPGADNPPKGMPEWLEASLRDGTRNFSRWLDSPSGKSFRDNLKDFGKRTGELRNSPAGDQARNTSQRLPKPGKWLTDNFRPTPPRLGDSTPRLGNAAPRMPNPSAPSVPRVSASSALEVVLLIAAGVLLLILAWKSRGLWKGVLSLGRSSTWRLGPWPVRPGAVTTRGDLVRAFEYLAFLCLGPGARSHHHLDLARLIGEQPALDPDRRREAASTLARLYEKARYVPDDEPLSPRDVEDARRELGYLAGGTAA